MTQAIGIVSNKSDLNPSPQNNDPGIPVVLGSDYETIDDLIYEFLRDRAETTARSYKRDLEHFFAFTSKNFDVPKLAGNKIDFNELKRVHLVRYKSYLKRKRNFRQSPVFKLDLF